MIALIAFASISKLFIETSTLLTITFFISIKLLAFSIIEFAFVIEIFI